MSVQKCIAELQEKAERFKTTNCIHVLDAEATVVKSDSMVSTELAAALKAGVESLEQIPDRLKDWHPGSNGMVLNLVHPSMCALAYGISRALPYGEVPLEECIKYSGGGEIVSNDGQATETKLVSAGWRNSINLPSWGSCQWLPSNLAFRGDGTASLKSYVNSLHPIKHADLYPVLEKLVDCAIPLWNESLSWFHDRIRLKIYSTSDEDYFIPEGMKYDGASDHSEDSEFFDIDDDYLEWKEETRVLTQHEPREFIPFDVLRQKRTESKLPAGAMPVDLREKFADSGLQVIFKLANIHLTPEKPEYQGGSWHVEGALNEHICATALYYYDEENITDSYLSFRQSIEVEELSMMHAQSEFNSLEEYFGVEQEGPAIQELGKVLTREGRLLAFPNVLQHCVHNFELKDKSRPGHRKLLAMFLVDPHIRVLSTANVAPQQRDWWAEEVRRIEAFARLPQELFDHIIAEVDGSLFDYERACEIRDKIMGERGALNSELNEGLANVSLLRDTREEDALTICSKRSTSASIREG